MTMFEHQIKGIIAVSVILAFIPFIRFLIPFLPGSPSPILSTYNAEKLIIEIVQEDEASGVFFVDPGTTLNQMFSKVQINTTVAEDLKLQNGLKIRIAHKGDHQGIILENMEAAKRLALGLPLDINLANQDELRLVPGIGDGLAANIVAWREYNGRFEQMDQLLEIKGIKEKKMSKLKQYLYVDKMAQ
ncbi:MAG: helix-hairpin-helix domain-containing protein [Deltaproteobacteria bacterium]